MEVRCFKCNGIIPEGRIKALPNTRVCVECSDTRKIKAFRIISGKNTYSEIQLVDDKKFSELSRKQARKGMSPGRGVWMDKR
jgi:translation initiation factor IF-1